MIDELDWNIFSGLDHQLSPDNDDDEGANNVSDESDGVNKITFEPPGDFDMSD